MRVVFVYFHVTIAEKRIVYNCICSCTLHTTVFFLSMRVRFIESAPVPPYYIPINFRSDNAVAEKGREARPKYRRAVTSCECVCDKKTPWPYKSRLHVVASMSDYSETII